MFISDSPEATARAGAECARHVRIGDVFALIGDLGAGKTQWAKGFVAGMGSKAAVTSPTSVRTPRCWLIADRVTSKRAETSPAYIGPRASSCRMRRRVGSAAAANASVTPRYVSRH